MDRTLPHTKNLPPAQQKHLHEDFIANEKVYWKIRERLMESYHGQWVAVHAGQVVTSGDDLLDVMDEVGRSGCYAYIARVGEEDDVVFTVRRREFDYDRTYSPFSLPQAEVTFSNFHGTDHRFYPDVIPDTGADLSVLPEDDCLTISLFSSPYLTSSARAVFGPTVTTLVYRGSAEVDGVVYRLTLLCSLAPLPPALLPRRIRPLGFVITCDDRLLRQCRRVRAKVWFGAPVAFCDKENLQ